MNQTQYLTATQVARLAKITKQRFYQLVSELRGPPISAYVSSVPVYDFDVVTQWIILRKPIVEKYSSKPQDTLEHLLAKHKLTPHRKGGLTLRRRIELYKLSKCKAAIRR